MQRTLPVAETHPMCFCSAVLCLNLLLDLRQLGGCLWFLCGMKEQLLSWLFRFSSWTFRTECLLYSGKQ